MSNIKQIRPTLIVCQKIGLKIMKGQMKRHNQLVIDLRRQKVNFNKRQIKRVLTIQLRIFHLTFSREWAAPLYKIMNTSSRVR